MFGGRKILSPIARSSVTSDLDREYLSFVREYGVGRAETFKRPREPSGQNEGLAHRLEFPSTSGDRNRSILDDLTEEFPETTPKYSRLDLQDSEKKWMQENLKLKSELSKAEAKLRHQQRESLQNQLEWERTKASGQDYVKKLEEKLEAQSVKLQALESKKQLDHPNRQLVHIQEQNSALSARLNQVREEMRNKSIEYSETEKAQSLEIERLRQLVHELKMKASESDSSAHSFQERIEQLEKSRNEVAATLETVQMELLQSKEETKEVEGRLREWEDKNQMAAAIRRDLDDYTALKSENEKLRQSTQHYRLKSENTLRLNEENYSLKQELARLRQSRETLINENNVLKNQIAEVMRSETGTPALSSIDMFATEVAKLEKARTDAQRLLDEAAVSLRQSEARIAELTEEISNLKTANQKQEAAQTNIIAEKDEIIAALQARTNPPKDYDPETEMILHMASNPLDEAHQAFQQEFETLKKENETLKIRNEELERERKSSSVSELNVTARVAQKIEDQAQHEQIKLLEEEKAKLLRAQDRMRTIHEKMARDYRETTTLLTGYQLKMKEEGLYQVQSTFEKTPEKAFVFKKTEENIVQLLDSNYVHEWGDFVETYLQTDDCIPAFLSAVTLQLHTREKEAAESPSTSGGDEDPNEDDTLIPPE